MRLAVKLMYAFGFLTILFSNPARAERPETDNVYQYIAMAGPMAFGSGGGAFLPLSILSGMKQGQVSPVMQFALINNMMTQCIEKVIQDVPGRREPFVSANAKFSAGFCRIRKCFEQAMLLEIMPQMSGNQSAGGSDSSAERESSGMFGMALAQAFQKQDTCAKGQPGIDPAMIQVFQSGI